MDPSYDSYFAYRSKVKLDKNLYAEALSEANKVIELNPTSYLGYELKHAALHGAQHYDDAFEAFNTMLSKLDNTPDRRIRQLRQKYINGFMESTEYKELLHSLVMHAPLQMEPIKEAVVKYFSWVMLSHKWETKEPLLCDVQGRDIYGLDPVGTVVKLQKFCKVSRDAGYRWAWVDTCCIDQKNDAELQQSVNSMFVWYQYSALTVVYLLDVSPSSKSGALAKSIWNTRGWTVQEFLSPAIVLFYQADWTLYLDNLSRNHKESDRIIRELERSTGINARTLVDFHRGTRDARKKLRWASNRDTTREEDIAYSLFGIFDVNLPVIYGETGQKALGRLLQEIIAHSGEITVLDWVGQPSNFNSCLPAEISSYNAPPYTPPPLSEYDRQISVSTLRKKIVAVKELYTVLEIPRIPRFANARLRLPCIVFPLTEVRQKVGTPPTYHIKADGLQDLEITTADTLVQFWPGKPAPQKFLLIRPWNRHDLGLPDFTDEMQSADDRPEPGSDRCPLGLSPSDKKLASSQQKSSLVVRFKQRFGALRLGQQKPADSQSLTRELGLVVRLGQPFNALLLAQQQVGEYKRIASDNQIVAQVRDIASAVDMMDIKTLEIL